MGDKAWFQLGVLALGHRGDGIGICRWIHEKQLGMQTSILILPTLLSYLVQHVQYSAIKVSTNPSVWEC